MFLAKFGSGHVCEDLLLCGWSRPEQDWVWSEGKFSALSVETVSCARCRLLLSIETPLTLGTDAVFRISVNGVDYGERRLATGNHVIALEHEAPATSKAGGLVISFFHETGHAPAESGGEDPRWINIGLKSLAIETLAPRYRNDVARFQDGQPCEAFFLKREWEGYARETRLKVEAVEAIGERGPGRALEFYLYGKGGNRHDRQLLWRGLLGAAVAQGVPGGDLGAPETVKDLVERIAPDFHPVLLAPHDGLGVEAQVIAPEIDNPLHDPVRRFPIDSHLGWMFREKRLPEERIHFARGAEVVAGPRQFLVFDPSAGAYYPACNPAGLTKLSTGGEVVEVEGPVVIAGDEFDHSNVAHFLFDGCLRIANFCDAFPELKGRALFVTNGRPTSLHRLAIDALCKFHGLSERQIVFPRQMARLRPAEGVYWFSDLAHDRHPCQCFRPEALEKFTEIAREMASRVAPSPHRAAKILISRTDATLRRLANEDELLDRLGPLGVRRVVMSRHSWAEQIDIVANADVIVAPHGMGMTLAAFNFRKPKVVEIFHPTIATSAYALMAKAYGMDYQPVFAVETDPRTLDYALSAADIEWIARLVAPRDRVL
jgi:hypothetical protein